MCVFYGVADGLFVVFCQRLLSLVFMVYEGIMEVLFGSYKGLCCYLENSMGLGQIFRGLVLFGV